MLGQYIANLPPLNSCTTNYLVFFQILAMLLLLRLSFWLLPVFADQQCLDQGACAAQCAASLRVCIADCSPPPLEQIEEEKGWNPKVYIWF